MTQKEQNVADREEYAPGPRRGVREQIETYERSGGTQGPTMRGLPVVLLTMRGRRTGKLRKVPLMRVEHEGTYAAVASIGGAPKHPEWYFNLQADPRVRLQDGPKVVQTRAREVDGAERAEWWERAVAAFGDYADYQRRTKRRIPLFVLEPVEQQAMTKGR